VATIFRHPRVRQILWFVTIIVIIASVSAGSKLSVLLEALRPPVLPKHVEMEITDWQSGQNWTDETMKEFHHKSQGSRTLNIPLAWFMALEQPSHGVLSFLFATNEKFSHANYLSRFGFIPSAESKLNPYGLPIGFAWDEYQTIAGIADAKTAVGFTCAACHTGQLVHDNKRYLVQGGQAMIDLGQLTSGLEAALGQTALASQIPLLDGRFERFARAVLKGGYSDSGVATLKQDLTNLVAVLSAQPKGVDVIEGFSRLDALNRIGNQVFSVDPGLAENYVNINAPVNYPPIWTSSWFDWVQYDGSIMQPLIRNTGEAMGTAAHTNLTAPLNEGRFNTATPLRNLRWIENTLAGEAPPLQNRVFTGLRAPKWPDAFGTLDKDMVAEGEALYAQHCQKCHLPALTELVESGKDPDSPFWQHFKPIQWWDGDELLSTKENVLQMNMVHQTYIGTDPGQGNVLAKRKINTAGIAENNTAGMPPRAGIGIDVKVCGRKSSIDPNSPLVTTTVTDNPLLAYPLALGALVQLGIDQWFISDRTSEQERSLIEGERPNCLQAGLGYKARPLNGIWATAPFLHNGSVPTLRHLLGNPDERPKSFLLGDATFDTLNVGVTTAVTQDERRAYSRDGYFIMRTEVPGNSNRGHEFKQALGDGRIGPALSDIEIAALLEFLKSI
jgi:hypothetical protein